MAPKQQGKQRLPPTTAAAKNQAEQELAALMRKGQGDNLPAKIISQAGVYLRAAILISLMAISANVSRLALSPVYGQIPASIYHDYVVWAFLFVGWATNVVLKRVLPFKTMALIPVIAWYSPMVQTYLFRLSSTLSIKYGPIVTEALTVGPLLSLGAAYVADILEEADMSALPQTVADAIPGMGGFAVFRLNEAIMGQQLSLQMGRSLMQSRMGMQFVLASVYSLMSRSKLLLWVIPAVLHAGIFNPHIPSPTANNNLNTTLSAQGWSLLDRWESITGYVSVIESHKDGYRLLRCDHSLLGGEWKNLPKTIVGEPVYSVFTQLEAVRLVENPKKVPDHQAKALNIGLGIGTTPSALIAHGIDTTIVEIDPIVYDFAVKYFDLPADHTAVIEDAISWGKKNIVTLAGHFDYIIHDVFTGGAEPIDLFTEEFLETLRALLSPSGVIAIVSLSVRAESTGLTYGQNFAGDFTLPSLSIVAKTVKTVFPSCRIFREMEAPPRETVEKEGRDFDNVIIFCTKTVGAITFRQPTEADFLKSYSRRNYLLPKHEVPDSAFMSGEKIGILRHNETSILAASHDTSAVGHWKIMRKVLPDSIWENW
ncbi:spermine/spermidine synthase [Microdochium trichocladiopsis]|uniref:Spermine/spermidine synthase n=1 Tax=Microdochium trichocladiopsis TaxID=1682393 RepID=A0A9P9BWR1_9PEZI|nr:spermine/spermidine synthase [Microdochium trichocladiopsis]KAH7040845.1 spermine/spermidine synthase [Microdochium trichocladiopsis]